MDAVGLAILAEELRADAAVMAEAGRLVERMTLSIPGVRPAFLAAGFRSQVRALKGFRHFFRHAYDPILRSDGLEELVRDANAVAEAFPGWVRTFHDAVRAKLQ